MLPIPSNENYLITKEGKVYSTYRDKFLCLRKTKDGYLDVHLTYRNSKSMRQLVHRLVAETYLPTWDPSLQVNHKDGNKINNHVSNLEMLSQVDNMIHAYKTNLIKKQGIDNHNAILKETDIYFIRANYKIISQKELAQMFNVKKNTISQIHQGLRWRHLL